jgi:hypothetical protein
MATEPQAHNGRPVVLDDGSFEFTIRKKDGAESTGKIDLLVLKLCCEQCENDHHLAVNNGMVIPTPPFLTDLCSRLIANGVSDCTPTVAWSLWRAGIDAMNQLKKTTNETPSSPSGTASTPEHSVDQKKSDGTPILSG